jgi:hypothetical protein
MPETVPFPETDQSALVRQTSIESLDSVDLNLGESSLVEELGGHLTATKLALALVSACASSYFPDRCHL